MYKVDDVVRLVRRRAGGWSNAAYKRLRNGGENLYKVAWVSHDNARVEAYYIKNGRRSNVLYHFYEEEIEIFLPPFELEDYL